jgi:hypothetical protein
VQVTSELTVSLDPRFPSRGQSAFQTDLCVFERISRKLELPRVVLEFKTRLTTHDVLTYSTKARRHKQIYPFLRYGLVISAEDSVPRRFFTHNEGLDFVVALGAMKRAAQRSYVIKLVRAEAALSRRLERIANGEGKLVAYRNVAVPEWAG